LKKLSIPVLILVIAASCSTKSKGWKDAERRQFVSDCTNQAKKGLDDAKAKAYCECMQPKIEAKYDSFEKANKVSQSDISTPEWTAEVQKCLQ
jgi:hypothetical protein